MAFVPKTYRESAVVVSYVKDLSELNITPDYAVFIACLCPKGPYETPTLINSRSHLISVFGDPTKNPTIYPDLMFAIQLLSNNISVYISRVLTFKETVVSLTPENEVDRRITDYLKVVTLPSKSLSNYRLNFSNDNVSGKLKLSLDENTLEPREADLTETEAKFSIDYTDIDGLESDTEFDLEVSFNNEGAPIALLDGTRAYLTNNTSTVIKNVEKVLEYGDGDTGVLGVRLFNEANLVATVNGGCALPDGVVIGLELTNEVSSPEDGQILATFNETHNISLEDDTPRVWRVAKAHSNVGKCVYVTIYAKNSSSGLRLDNYNPVRVPCTCYFTQSAVEVESLDLNVEAGATSASNVPLEDVTESPLSALLFESIDGNFNDESVVVITED